MCIFLGVNGHLLGTQIQEYFLKEKLQYRYCISWSNICFNKNIDGHKTHKTKLLIVLHFQYSTQNGIFMYPIILTTN